MGLLDPGMYQDPDQMAQAGLTQGLLAAGGASRLPVTLAAALAQGMGQAQTGYQQGLTNRKSALDLQSEQLQLQNQLAFQQAIQGSGQGQAAPQPGGPAPGFAPVTPIGQTPAMAQGSSLMNSAAPLPGGAAQPALPASLTPPSAPAAPSSPLIFGRYTPNQLGNIGIIGTMAGAKGASDFAKLASEYDLSKPNATSISAFQAGRNPTVANAQALDTANTKDLRPGQIQTVNGLPTFSAPDAQGRYLSFDSNGVPTVHIASGALPAATATASAESAGKTGNDVVEGVSDGTQLGPDGNPLPVGTPYKGLKKDIFPQISSTPISSAPAAPASTPLPVNADSIARQAGPDVYTAYQQGTPAQKAALINTVVANAQGKQADFSETAPNLNQVGVNAPLRAPSVIASDLSPGVATTNKTLVDRNQSIIASAQSVGQDRQALEHMVDLANSGTIFGPGAAKASTWQALAAQVPGVNSILSPDDLQKPMTDVSVMKKLTSGMAGRLSGQSGTGTDARLQNAIDSLPNDTVPNAGIKRLAPILIGQQSALTDQANIRQGLQTPAQMSQFESNWRNAYNPDAYEAMIATKNMTPKQAQSYMFNTYKPAQIDAIAQSIPKLRALGAQFN